MTRHAAKPVPRHAPPTTSHGAEAVQDAEGQEGASTALRYVVPGRPITWARARLDTRGRRPRVLTDDSQRAAKAAHAMLARVALRGRAWDLGGAFEVEVIGYWPDAVVGDSDRLASLALDALEGIAYRTDRQVRREIGSVATDYEGPARTEVVVRRLAVDPVQKKPRTRQRRM